MKILNTMAFALAAALLFVPISAEAKGDKEEFTKEMKEEREKAFDLRIEHHKAMASQLQKTKKVCMGDDKEACKKAHEEGKAIRDDFRKKMKELKAKRKGMREEMREEMKERKKERNKESDED